MIQLCLLLLAIGIIFLIAEMFFPGFGLFGGIGIVSLVASAVIAIIFVPFGWVIVAIEVVILLAFFFYVIHFVKKRQLQGKLFMAETLNDDEPIVADLESYVGKDGVAITPLRPVGVADFGGIHFEVNSEGAYIEKGSKIKVVTTQDNKLFVRAMPHGN